MYIRFLCTGQAIEINFFLFSFEIRSFNSWYFRDEKEPSEMRVNWVICLKLVQNFLEFVNENKDKKTSKHFMTKLGSNWSPRNSTSHRLTRAMVHVKDLFVKNRRVRLRIFQDLHRSLRWLFANDTSLNTTPKNWQ